MRTFLYIVCVTDFRNVFSTFKRQYKCNGLPLICRVTMLIQRTTQFMDTHLFGWFWDTWTSYELYNVAHKNSGRAQIFLNDSEAHFTHNQTHADCVFIYFALYWRDRYEHLHCVYLQSASDGDNNFISQFMVDSTGRTVYENTRERVNNANQ